jgi:hypothetical protein
MRTNPGGGPIFASFGPSALSGEAIVINTTPVSIVPRIIASSSGVPAAELVIELTCAGQHSTTSINTPFPPAAVNHLDFFLHRHDGSGQPEPR